MSEEEAYEYARATQAKMTSALDLYVWEELRDYYAENGLPVRGSDKWKEVEKIKVAAFLSFHKLSPYERSMVEMRLRERQNGR